MIYQNQILRGALVLLLAWISTPAIQANDVLWCGLLKGQQFQQSVGGGAPTEKGPMPFLFSAELKSLMGLLSNTTIKPPSNIPYSFTNNDTMYNCVANFTGANALSTAFGSGTYTINYDGTLDGSASFTVNFANGTFPEAPQISNLAAAQTIDPAQDFALNWNVVTGATEQDFFEISIVDDAGYLVFSTDGINGISPLSGLINTVTISSGYLEAGKTYTGKLIFYRVLLNQKFEFPNLTLPAKLTSYFSATEFPLKTKNAQPPVDTVPPTLVFSNPTNNATGIDPAVGSYMTFVFSEPMANPHSILWSSNIDAGKMSYSWLEGQTALLCTYAGSLPAQATIRWTLNPTTNDLNQFKDAAGNPLATAVFTGQFATAGSGGAVSYETNQPICPTANFAIWKMLSYTQTNQSAPTLDPTSCAIFSAVAKYPGNSSSTAYVKLPSAAIKPLMMTVVNSTVVAGTFAQAFDSQEALDASYPIGTYDVVAQGNATNRASFTWVANDYPPTPQVQNYNDAQLVNAAMDFALNWNVFTGATTNDAISLSVSDGGQTVFQRLTGGQGTLALAVTASSVVLPMNTLQTGKSYRASLTFYRIPVVNIPLGTGDPGLAGFIKQTEFSIKTGATTTKPIKLAGAMLNQKLQLSIDCTPAIKLVIQSVSQVNGQWQDAFMTNPVADKVVIEWPLSSSTNRLFFRAYQ